MRGRIFSNNSVLITPPKQISKSYYRCDNKFHLDDILEMYEDDEHYGIVLVSGEKCCIYDVTKSGTHVQCKKMKNSEVHQLKGHRKGGQSAPRFQRLRDENEEAQVKKVVESMIQTYWNDKEARLTVSAILIGGPAEFKNKVREHPLTIQYFDKVIVGTITTGPIEDGLAHQMYEKNEGLFVGAGQRAGAELIKHIYGLMDQASDKLIYGYDEAVDALTSCLLETLIISDKVEKDKIENLDRHNTYGCKITVVDYRLLAGRGIDVIGAKFY